mgnify:CR=1 FL=1
MHLKVHISVAGIFREFKVSFHYMVIPCFKRHGKRLWAICTCGKKKDTISSHLRDLHVQELPSHVQAVPLHVREIPLHVKEIPLYERAVRTFWTYILLAVVFVVYIPSV